MSDLDALRLAGLQPQGPSRAADLSTVAVGRVLGVNAAAGLVLVSVHGSEGSWVPAVAGRYRVAGVCRVLLDPWAGGRTAVVLGAVDPLAPSVLATLTGLDEVANRATVAWAGGPVTVPFLPSTYTISDEVWVDLDDWGRPFRVVGPSDDPPAAAPVVLPSAPASASTAQATTTIFPQWSGSYRTGSGWDRWNTNRYGGRSTLYQGSGYGSGPMKGLATYGDQLVNLGAVTIDKVTVRLVGAGLSGAAGPATVQGSPHGERPDGAPSSSGDTATGDGVAELPATVREAMRTGAVKGLALVGANYWAVLGAGPGGGMALDVTYTRPI